VAAKNNDFFRIDPTSAVVFLVLLILGEAILGYLYILKPKTEMLKQETQSVENLRYREMIMRAEYESIPDLKVKIEANNNEIKNKAQKLPGYIAQEEMLLTVNDYILSTGIKIANIGLTKGESAKLSDILTKSGVTVPEIKEADKYNIIS
jgi:Tfp pilus assembly protein PilO